MTYIKDFLKCLLASTCIMLFLLLLLCGPAASILLAIFINPWFTLLLIPAIIFDGALIGTILINSYK